MSHFTRWQGSMIALGADVETVGPVAGTGWLVGGLAFGPVVGLVAAQTLPGVLGWTPGLYCAAALGGATVLLGAAMSQRADRHASAPKETTVHAETLEDVEYAAEGLINFGVPSAYDLERERRAS